MYSKSLIKLQQNCDVHKCLSKSLSSLWPIVETSSCEPESDAPHVSLTDQQPAHSAQPTLQTDGKQAKIFFEYIVVYFFGWLESTVL